LARIVVVEVDDADRARLRALLVDAGHEVTEACSFQEGRSVLAREAANLLVTNVRLGAFNGLQLLSTGQVHIPAIVVTGFDDTVLRADANVFGASYVVKPISPAALIALIDRKLALPESAEGGGSDPLLMRDTSAEMP